MERVVHGPAARRGGEAQPVHARRGERHRLPDAAALGQHAGGDALRHRLGHLARIGVERLDAPDPGEAAVAPARARRLVRHDGARLEQGDRQLEPAVGHRRKDRRRLAQRNRDHADRIQKGRARHDRARRVALEFDRVRPRGQERQTHLVAPEDRRHRDDRAQRLAVDRDIDVEVDVPRARRRIELQPVEARRRKRKGRFARAPVQIEHDRAVGHRARDHVEHRGPLGDHARVPAGVVVGVLREGPAGHGDVLVHREVAARQRPFQAPLVHGGVRQRDRFGRARRRQAQFSGRHLDRRHAVRHRGDGEFAAAGLHHLARLARRPADRKVLRIDGLSALRQIEEKRLAGRQQAAFLQPDRAVERLGAAVLQKQQARAALADRAVPRDRDLRVVRAQRELDGTRVRQPERAQRGLAAAGEPLVPQVVLHLKPLGFRQLGRKEQAFADARAARVAGIDAVLGEGVGLRGLKRQTLDQVVGFVEDLQVSAVAHLAVEIVDAVVRDHIRGVDPQGRAAARERRGWRGQDRRVLNQHDAAAHRVAVVRAEDDEDRAQVQRLLQAVRPRPEQPARIHVGVLVPPVPEVQIALAAQGNVADPRGLPRRLRVGGHHVEAGLRIHRAFAHVVPARDFAVAVRHHVGVGVHPESDLLLQRGGQCGRNERVRQGDRDTALNHLQRGSRHTGVPQSDRSPSRNPQRIVEQRALIDGSVRERLIKGVLRHRKKRGLCLPGTHGTQRQSEQESQRHLIFHRNLLCTAPATRDMFPSVCLQYKFWRPHCRSALYVSFFDFLRIARPRLISS